jgi:hypothetical protein
MNDSEKTRELRIEEAGIELSTAWLVFKSDSEALPVLGQFAHPYYSILMAKSWSRWLGFQSVD